MRSELTSCDVRGRIGLWILMDISEWLEPVLATVLFALGFYLRKYRETEPVEAGLKLVDKAHEKVSNDGAV